MTEPVARYPYVAIDVPEEEADECGARLFELGALGVEHRDATTLVRGAAAKVTLVASFEQEQDARAAMDELPAEWTPRFEEVVGDAWRDEWKKFFEPFTLCPGVVVRPPWRAVAETEEAHVIELEPGRAFGTGLHETTSLVAQVIAELPLHGATVLDVGCGSGILALVALRLGASRARAIDVDPDAVAVTRENALRNGLADRVHVDSSSIEEVSGDYPLVVANIESKTLVPLATAIAARVAPGGTLVLSGILAADVAPTQLTDVLTAYAMLREREVRRKGEWVAVVLERPQ